MPPPIVPAPITAARRISEGCVPARPGILDTARSAKKAWISALDCVECRHSRNSSASCAHPSSKGRRVAASTASMAASGAVWPRFDFCACRRAAAKIAGSAVAQFGVAPAGPGRLVAGDFAGKRDSARQQVALDDPVHDARGERLVGADRFAESAHLDGLGNPRQARQSLRARCPGNDAELHLRLPHLRSTCHHAIVPGHRDFQAAAEGLTVDRHDHRLRTRLDHSQKWQQAAPRLLAPDDLDELPYVGAGDEGPSSADDDDGGHARIGGGVFDGGLNGFGNSGA